MPLVLRLPGIQSSKADLAIKVIFFLLFGLVLYYQLFWQHDWNALQDEFRQQLATDNWIYLGIAILLMPVNWILEARKWRILLRSSIQISTSQALRAIASGLSFSLLTPNRIGEYVGRMVHVKSRYNWDAALSTLAGSIAQNIVNIVLGLLALTLLLRETVLSDDLLFWSCCSAVILLSILLLFLYFRIDLVSTLISALKWSFIKQRWKEKFVFFRNLDRGQLLSALRLSTLRYGVFCTQYVLMFLFFGVDLPVFSLFTGVSVIYLMHTSVPLPPLLDQLLRAQLSLIIWANTAENELSLLSAGFFIWIINVVKPSFLGVISVGKARLLKSFGYEYQQTHLHPADTNRNLDEYPESGR